MYEGGRGEDVGSLFIIKMECRSQSIFRQSSSTCSTRLWDDVAECPLYVHYCRYL